MGRSEVVFFEVWPGDGVGFVFYEYLVLGIWYLAEIDD